MIWLESRPAHLKERPGAWRQQGSCAQPLAGWLTCREPSPGGGQTMEASGGGGGSRLARRGRGEVLITWAGCWTASAGTVQCWRRHDTEPCSGPLCDPPPPPRAPARARSHYRSPGTRLDALQGAALGSQSCPTPARLGPDNNGARPRSPVPAGPLQPRPGPIRACVATGTELTFPPRHACGPGPAE